MCVVNSLFSANSSSIVSFFQGLFNIYTTVQTIKVQNTQAELSANAAKKNAEIARQNAMLERQEALENARLQRLKTIQGVSAMKTSIAAGNIALGSETALDLIDTVSLSGELDALNILKKGEENAQKQLLAAKMYDEKADFYISQRKNQLKNTAVSLLGGALINTAKKWEDMQNNMLLN